MHEQREREKEGRCISAIRRLFKAYAIAWTYAARAVGAAGLEEVDGALGHEGHGDAKEGRGSCSRPRQHPPIRKGALECANKP